MLQSYDPRNADIVYWVNGVLHHRDEPGLSPFDSVVQGGDAVWEGLRVYDGKVFALTEHLGRLRRSAQALAFSHIPSDADIAAAISATLRANHMTDGVHIRLTLTRGVKITSGMDPRLNTARCTLIVLAEHKPPVYDSGGITLITSSLRRPGPDVLDPKIHSNNLLNSILAKIEANVAGADDAVMLDRRGFVAETNATHLFAVIDAGLVTPRAIACPEGITRSTVLRLAADAGLPYEVGDFPLTRLYSADEAFVTGTMGELTPVLVVDGRTIGDGAPGPLTRKLSADYAALTASSGTVVV